MQNKQQSKIIYIAGAIGLVLMVVYALPLSILIFISVALIVAWKRHPLAAIGLLILINVILFIALPLILSVIN